MYRTIVKICDESLFNISCGDGVDNSFGCDQGWYPTMWQRNSGCGPSTAANMFYYMSQVNPSTLEKLKWNTPAKTKECLLDIMNEVWEYVTPTMRGLYSTELFVNGVKRFTSVKELDCRCKATNVPNKPFRRKITWDEFYAALHEGFAEGYPVAFLNLSNGKLDNLHRWHWITLMSLEQDDMGNYFCLASDEGVKKMINIKLWFETTTLGGGIVSFSM